MDITLQRIIAELKAKQKKKIELTDHLGLVNSAFGNWVSGRNKSYRKYIHGIADFLGVSVEYLKGETDQKEKPSIQMDEGREMNTIRIAGRDGTYIERHLTDEQIDLFKRMIEQMPEFKD